MADLTRYKIPLRHPGNGPVRSRDTVVRDFIEGARNNGFGRHINIDLNGEKIALAGPDDLLGALVGHLYGKAQVDRGENYSFGLPQAGSLLLPGGLGYQVGRGLTHAVRNRPEKTPLQAGKEAALKKFANNAAELAALGMLQIPTAYHLYHDFKDNKPVEEKAMHGMELGGLGLMSGNIIRSMMRGQ